MANNPSAKGMWQPTIPVNQSIYEASTTQKAPLGTRLEVGDRVFHYGYNAASVNGGVCLSYPAVGGTAEELVSCAGTSGDNYLTFTAGTNMAANDYAEGYLYNHTVTGGIATYRIKSHGSIGSAATGTVYLYDTLAGSIVAADTVGISKNIYKNVAVYNADTSFVVGVSPVALTATSYAWLQTYGPATVTCGAGETSPQGDTVVAATAAGFGAGGATGDAVGNTVIGKMMGLAVTTGEASLVWLTLRP